MTCDKRKLLLILILAGLGCSTAARGQLARFAVVVGNNRGADRQATLRYAQLDAQRFARLLTDLGGFAPENVVLLKAQSVSAFRDALRTINQKIASLVPREVPRALLVVYFSGHADGVSLELGSGRFAYREFRELLEGSAAQIKLAFVDSCQSGGLIASKGFRPGPAFDLTVTDHIEASGTVMLTSSSAGESSQESEEIQGSFFTHYLLSGLRGAADQDRDRQVTLAEVYQYTYDKTVVETSRTLGGTQHPAYDYQIEGRGKVVLADLSRGEASLQFGPDTAGEFLVIRADLQQVLAELSKTYGVWRDLALSAGSYRVARRSNGRLFSQQVALKPHSRVRVDPSAMREEGSLLASFKQSGSARGGIGVFAYYGLMSGALKDFAAVHQGMLGLRVDLGPVSIFPRLAYGQARIEDDVLSYSIRLYSLDSLVTWRFEYSLLDLFCGVKLGLSYGNQRLQDDQELSGTIFSYGAVGGIDLPLYAGLALQVFWEVGAEAFKLDGELSQHLSLKGVVGLGYQF